MAKLLACVPIADAAHLNSPQGCRSVVRMWDSSLLLPCLCKFSTVTLQLSFNKKDAVVLLEESFGLLLVFPPAR